MNNPRFSSLRGFAPDNKQVQPISLPIPPPPLPPRFPPTNIPPPPIPPFLHPPTFFSQQPTHTPISTLPTHTFQSDTAQPVAVAKWVARSDATDEYHYHYSSLADEGSQEILNRWLRSKKRPVSAKKPTNNVKIYYVKEKLNAAHNLIRELENDARTLSVMVKAVRTSEWNQKCNEIELKKTELLNIFNELKFNKEDLDEVKEKSLKRSKKRDRLRRQALRRKRQKENDKLTSQNLHFRIDNWQKEMQEIVERTKRERELQQEADAVLWGVRQRKGEAGRQLELLTTLEDLREARVRRRSAAGQPTSAVEIQTFNTVIKRLKALWTRRLSECQLEEQVLRGMLTEAEVTQDAVSTYKKLVLQEWQWAIFGCSSALGTDHNLLDIRRSWDQFAVDEHTVLASPVPPGWVLPGPPSSELWKSQLKY